MRFINQSNAQFLQGSFQLLYSIIALPRGDEVESGRISLNEAIQNKSSPLTTQQFGGLRIVLRTGGVRVVCREGYFGPDCGCTPRDDSTGHFTCDVNGAIVCLPGYQNTATNCVEEVITPEPIISTNTETIAVGKTTTRTLRPTPSTRSSSIIASAAQTTSTTQAHLSTIYRIETSASIIVHTRSTTGETAVGHISTTQNLLIPTTTIVSRDGTSSVPSVTTSTGNSGDIVPIVAGGVAGGLVVLLLGLIVNIVLVIIVVKIKYMKHHSNKQGTL